MIHKQKQKIWHNHNGAPVPLEYIGHFDRAKEAALSSISNKAIRMSNQLADFKKYLFDKCDDLYLKMLQEAEIDPKNRKGNYTLFSFDKSVKVEIKVQNTIVFDDHINLAQEVINEYLQDVTQGANPDLATLVNNAFQTTKGRLDTKRILNLFSLKIKNEKWTKAMDLIKKSMSTNHTARYVNVYTRDDNGDYINIPLNISAV